MDELFRLALLSLAMFVGCYLAGSIPLILTLSESVLRKTTTFAAGLLIGTALIVIIPEGVESLYEEILHGAEGHSRRPRLPPSPSQDDQLQLGQPVQLDSEIHKGPMEHHLESVTSLGTSEGYTADELHVVMGTALVLGFLFMLLVEHFGGGGHAHSPSSSSSSSSSSVAKTADVESAQGTGQHNRKKLTATIGLVVHAAADGLALGAAAGLSKVDVELIIFLAIMLHKAPAAFGLSTFLIHEGYDRYTARRHLLVFSLAAPVAAFVSYFGLVRVMYTVQFPIPGVAMLFSAGTFLYVATVHVLNEVTQMSPSPSLELNSNSSSTSSSNSKLSTVELVMVVSGALLPLLFGAVHSH